MILFETFKQFLQLITADTKVVGRNVILQDEDYAAAISNHISALTYDQNIRLNTTNADPSSASGLMVVDQNTREIRFETSGSGKLAQGYLEANITNVTKLWQRSDDASGTVTGIAYGTLLDGRRYYATDTTRGVFYLNEYGQIIGAVPGFQVVTGSGYGVPTSAITFSIASVEYIAIASAALHIVNIYTTSDFVLVDTIGTASTPGLADADLLDTPTDVAFDAASTTLFVSCTGAGPAGSTGPGWVAAFDLSTFPGAVYSSYIAINTGLALDQLGVFSPEGIFYDPTLDALWVLSVDTSNTTRPLEIGAISLTAGVSDGYLNGYLEFRGVGFSTSNTASKIHVDISRRRLYLTNSPGVEVFDIVTMAHLYTFGFFSQDEDAANTNSPFFSPVTGQVQAVCSDVLSVNSLQSNLLLFNDITNNRLVRVSENLYEGENVALFDEMTFVVPVSLHGYLVKGTISSSKVIIEYRTVSGGIWQVLSQTDTVLASQFFQFRLKVNADLHDVITSRSIKDIIVIGEQE